MESNDVPESHALGTAVEIVTSGVSPIGGGMEIIRDIHVMNTIVIALGEEKDSSEESCTGGNGTEPPKPLKGKILSDPAFDDNPHRRTAGEE
jgi:hypothetical protein